ncbi:hypothetical protein SERLA73DRAFT_170636 [Serpula lacrymans var. lacrymans S7.3]|uniref:Sterol regulatory element-binding protein cleavage-activating protein n=2 Tax=Serpula lacrymans var. lacrymans TaxID=341189 RepID=F8Q6K3_SERL3|nr:uncharacterized protein SERLADRAFT_451783 [Serpula lacrymans var. lacrymans S7.9]EGN96241.1 hypothetical protein SERLA73DRAFT_170636 [Serpula lacrymans var. lacrymans S7.3]EGO21780.1 hypothetical protein SERLADRAFT_451783 [Serpula lacrymans var. lacrymans S7.9]
MSQRNQGFLSYGPYILQRIRTIAELFLRSFGIHCATHQIRLILISSLVITSLLYPALAIYSSSPSYSLVVSTSTVLDSFLSANVQSGVYAQRDLLNFWQGHQTLRLREDGVSRARCGKDRTLRVERILVRSNMDSEEDTGALNHQTLLSTLQLERRILEGLSSHGLSCLKGPKGDCFVLSPLAFWHHDEAILRADKNISLTLESPSNEVMIDGLRITPHMVLAGRETYDRDSTKFDFAMFLALTFFFPDSDCLANSGHDAWLEIVGNATTESVMFAEAVEPTLIALEYDNSSSRTSAFSAISTFLYLAYISFFVYVSWSMRRMDGVHSRVGLTFTALVEIAVSTITSLSVCALVGFKVTMVPWGLLPIVIVFVGAENMFSLVDAVTKTSVTLPVKERIAEGLSRAGTSNTLKVVTYNSLLGVMAVLSAGAIRQFCAFAIVVLVAHWFLAHTFFLAVLSIDIQRLELDELLRQNPSLAPAMPNSLRESPSAPAGTKWQQFTRKCKNLLKGRATKNLSFVLLLAITATLYLMTRPSAHSEADTNPSLRGPSPRLQTNQSGADMNSPAWHIWKILNPGEDTLVHLRIEVPTIVTFQPESQTDRGVESKARSRPAARSFRPLLWLLKIVVLPMALTTTALYGLLLYLLKDAELLEAQRNRPEGDMPSVNMDLTLESQVSFTTLPRAFSTDVELLAASMDRRIVAAVDLQNEFVIWRTDNYSHISIDATDVLLRGASTSSAASALTAVAVDDAGRFCAVGTGAGTIAVWSIDDKSIKPFPHLTLESTSIAVVELQFLPLASPTPLPRSEPYSKSSSPTRATETAFLVAVYENGLVVKWKVGSASSPEFVSPTRLDLITKSMVSRVQSDDSLLVAFSMADGSLELSELAEGEPSPPSTCFVQAGNSSDLVTKAHACRVKLDGEYRTVVGVTTEAGVVSLWNGRTGECISILEEVHGNISQIRISSISSETCRFCGELPLDTFLVTLSIGHIVLFYTVHVTPNARRCSCAGNIPRQISSRDLTIGRRSRSSSMASLSGGSSGTRRLSVASNSSNPDFSAFPVSAHGIHSRRASEKDTHRRPSDSLTLPVLSDENDADHPVGPLNISTIPLTPWKSVVVVRCGDARCERGGWDVANGKILGVRRKSRTELQVKATTTSNPLCGLSSAALDRWELWIFDPILTRMQSSGLSTLSDNFTSTHPLDQAQVHSRRSSSSSNAKDEHPRIPFTRVSPLIACQSQGIAGFGNTVGLFYLSSS